MTRDPYHHTATALKLAAEGVTVTELADACSIDHATAHRVLVRLTDEGVLQRTGGPGRTGHTYRVSLKLVTSTKF